MLSYSFYQKSWNRWWLTNCNAFATNVWLHIPNGRWNQRAWHHLYSCLCPNVKWRTLYFSFSWALGVCCSTILSIFFLKNEFYWQLFRDRDKYNISMLMCDVVEYRGLQCCGCIREYIINSQNIKGKCKKKLIACSQIAIPWSWLDQYSGSTKVLRIWVIMVTCMVKVF